MSHKLECPWCGMVAGSYQKLACHLAGTAHRKRRPCPGRLHNFQGTQHCNYCICICGQYCVIVPNAIGIYPTLAEHLRSAGGACAHLLAVTLGVERDV